MKNLENRVNKNTIVTLLQLSAKKGQEQKQTQYWKTQKDKMQ